MADKKLRLQWIQEQAELTTLNPKTTQKTCELVSHTRTHTPSHVSEKHLLYNDHYNIIDSKRMKIRMAPWYS